MRQLRFLWILLIVCMMAGSCGKRETTLLDAVPTDANVVVESADSALIMMFDTILSAHVNPEEVTNGMPMAIVSVPAEEQVTYVLLKQTSKKRIEVFGESQKACEAVRAQLKNTEKIHTNPDFQRLQKTLGRHVKAHLYYRDPRGWVLLDVLPEDNALIMNGYALAADSTSSWRPLKYQRPVKNSVVNILPYDTRSMLHYGMSDYASYWQSFHDEDKIRAFNKKYATDVENKFLAHLSEVSCDVVGKQREIFVARMNDPSAVIKFMNRFASKKGVAESQTLQGYSLYDLGKCDFVPTVFGDDFKSMTHCCYAIVDQYLVMASSFEPIQELVSCYRSGRTLDLNEGFRQFQQKMLESANITTFEVDGDRTNSIQLAASKDLVYVNICLSKGTEVKSESNVRWKVNLDAPLQGKPFIVEDHASSDMNVVAFDQLKTMYLIDSDGTILWKKSLPEPPLSDVFTVDCYRNGKLQFLFNTAHTIQLIDRNGNDVEGYPITLPFEASNGLSVFDYKGNRDYRVLLCGTDRLVYNYTLQGKEVEDWNRHRAEDLVKQPVKHIVSDNKDYLIVSDVSGGVRILDRQGLIRIPLSSQMQKSPQSDIYANVTNSRKGLFLTTDKEGKLLYVAADGALNKTDFGTYSDKHFFLYEDFNGDQDPDFIYLDQKNLHVFDRYKKELYHHQFDVEISTTPVFFNITRKKRLLGVVSEKAREIYLIDRKGNMIVNSGLVGETPFAVGSLHNDHEINLITGVGNALFNYSIY